MTDFGGYRSLFLDFGADPGRVDTMSMGALSGMISAIQKKRGAVEVPPEEDRKKALDSFLVEIAHTLR
jgi:hypothetical protein